MMNDCLSKLTIISRTVLFCLLWPSSEVHADGDIKLDVNGAQRVVRVFAPVRDSAKPRPVLLAFHGYDDDRHHFSRFVDLHKEWPEAIVAYPQGERLPDRDGELRAKGWQTRLGMVNDRDLAFTDALLEYLEANYTVDTERIYATGMSNGGRFCFLLWAERADRFAAFAPVAIAATSAALQSISEPRPVLYMIGEQEPRWRLEDAGPTSEVISRVNRSLAGKEPWGEYIRFIPFEGGADFVFNLHRGGHIWPSDASREIVRFFSQFDSKTRIKSN